MPIKIIIFDLGNVVLTNDWHEGSNEKIKIKEYSEYFGISESGMEKAWRALWPGFKTGKMTEEEFWARFLRIAGAKRIDIRHAKILWRKYQKPIENMLGLLKKLKKNYRLAALADIGKEWLDYKGKKYGLDSYFDVVVSSGYSGFSKPDKQIYEFLLQKLNISPQKCLFIDDMQQNLLPAKKMGMKVILFRGQKDLEVRLRKLSINY